MDKIIKEKSQIAQQINIINQQIDELTKKKDKLIQQEKEINQQSLYKMLQIKYTN
jgi:hypothetical protein